MYVAQSTTRMPESIPNAACCYLRIADGARLVVGLERADERATHQCGVPLRAEVFADVLFGHGVGGHSVLYRRERLVPHFFMTADLVVGFERARFEFCKFAGNHLRLAAMNVGRGELNGARLDADNIAKQVA